MVEQNFDYDLLSPTSLMQKAAPGAALDRIDGIETWRIVVPANGAATLAHSLPER